MAEIIVPTLDQGIEFENLRKGIASCIKVVATKAVVYSNWPLRYDIGDTVNLLTSEADDNKVHAWMVSINRLHPSDNKAGGHNINWDLNVRIWCFVGYDSIDSTNTINTIESEVKGVTEVLYANSKHLGLSDTQGLTTTGLVKWDDIDVHSFGGDSDVHVAQGNLGVTLRTHLTGY